MPGGPTRQAEKLANGHYKVTVSPPPEMELPAASVELDPAAYARYAEWLQKRGPIQDYLPDLDPDTREVLLSGFTPETWERMFSGGPE